MFWGDAWEVLRDVFRMYWGDFVAAEGGLPLAVLIVVVLFLWGGLSFRRKLMQKQVPHKSKHIFKLNNLCTVRGVAMH